MSSTEDEDDWVKVEQPAADAGERDRVAFMRDRQRRASCESRSLACDAAAVDFRAAHSRC